MTTAQTIITTPQTPITAIAVPVSMVSAMIFSLEKGNLDLIVYESR